MTRLSTIPFVLLLGACGDPLLDPQRIERPRVLGARLEVDGDEMRSSPSAGDSVTVRWLVAAPASPLASSYAFAACGLTAEQSNDPVECADQPFALLIREASDVAAPVLQFQVPAEFTAARLGVVGQFCANGETTPLADGFDCVGDGARALPASFDTLTSQRVPNRNTSLAAAAPRFAGAEWLPPDGSEAGQPCAELPASGALPKWSRASGETRVGLDLDTAQREAIEVDEVGPARETLQLSLMATAGRLKQAYVVVEPEDERAIVPVDVGYRLPQQLAEQGLVVRFYFVLRDLRGGVDWLVRDACVVP